MSSQSLGFHLQENDLKKDWVTVLHGLLRDRPVSGSESDVDPLFLEFLEHQRSVVSAESE